jgi:hypothetical protein
MANGPARPVVGEDSYEHVPGGQDELLWREDARARRPARLPGMPPTRIELVHAV